MLIIYSRSATLISLSKRSEKESRKILKKGWIRQLSTGSKSIKKFKLPNENKRILIDLDNERDFEYINSCWDIHNISNQIQSHLCILQN